MGKARRRRTTGKWYRTMGNALQGYGGRWPAKERRWRIIGRGDEAMAQYMDFVDDLEHPDIRIEDKEDAA